MVWRAPRNGRPTRSAIWDSGSGVWSHDTLAVRFLAAPVKLVWFRVDSRCRRHAGFTAAIPTARSANSTPGGWAPRASGSPALPSGLSIEGMASQSQEPPWRSPSPST